MTNDKANQYGTIEWFNGEYAKVEDDPWYTTFRSSLKVRYGRVLKLLDAVEFSPISVLDIGCATGDFTH